MICPHCARETKGPVLETRTNHDGVWRRRCCGPCGKYFVTHEVTSPDIKMPSEFNTAHKRREAKSIPSPDFRTITTKELERVWR